MVKRIRKQKKHIIPVTPPILKDKTQIQEGQFPLNINDSDRISWKVEMNAQGITVRVNNISYEIKINEQWVWIVRYDDHDGFGEFHRHERFYIESETNGYAAVDIDQTFTKQQQKQWAIDDIRRNYLGYREKFLERNGLAIYE